MCQNFVKIKEVHFLRYLELSDVSWHIRAVHHCKEKIFFISLKQVNTVFAEIIHQSACFLAMGILVDCISLFGWWWNRERQTFSEINDTFVCAESGIEYLTWVRKLAGAEENGIPFTKPANSIQLGHANNYPFCFCLKASQYI